MNNLKLNTEGTDDPPTLKLSSSAALAERENTESVPACGSVRVALSIKELTHLSARGGSTAKAWVQAGRELLCEVQILGAAHMVDDLQPEWNRSTQWNV